MTIRIRAVLDPEVEVVIEADTDEEAVASYRSLAIAIPQINEEAHRG